MQSAIFGCKIKINLLQLKLVDYSESILLDCGHGLVERGFALRPGADVAVSLARGVVFEYLADGNRTFQPASLYHLLNDSFERVTFDAAVHRQRPAVDPIRRRSDK